MVTRNRPTPHPTIHIHSINTGQVPDDWKKTNTTEVFKERSRTAARNYRTISPTSVPCKIMEHILLHHIMVHLDTHRILTDFQHGLRQGRHPCETQLSTITEKVARNVDHIIKAKHFEKSQYISGDD